MLEPFRYILSKDIAQLTLYLEYGNVNIQDENGCSLLCYAIKLHDNEAFKLLIKSYVDVNLADHDGNTSFHYAVYHNRLGYLKMLLKLGGNPLKKNNAGQSPIFLACLYGRQTLLDLYLEKYPLDLDDTDHSQETIMMALVRSRNLTMLKRYSFQRFLEKPNYIGDTPLSISVKIRAYEITAYLISLHAFVNHRNHLGETPLFDAVRNQDRAMIMLLLNHGACMDMRNNSSETIDSLVENEEIQSLLLEQRSISKIRDYPIFYPLHYAILMQDDSSFKKYLNFRYLEQEDPYGNTPMMLADKLGQNKMLVELKQQQQQLKILKFQRIKKRF